MKGRSALVTGGLGGIGTAICQRLCDEGADVIATYFRQGDHASAQQWREEQLKMGYDIAIYYVDVTDFNSCENLFKQMGEKNQEIDILVNNAGITADVPFYKMDQKQWEVVLHTNLDSLFNMTRQVINAMIKRGYGRIINISSINGQKGQYGQTNYSASKAGIHGFTKALALEVANKGITVNTISPGYIGTKMVMKMKEEIIEKIIAQIPVGRLGKPEEVAQAVCFLASESSGYITGSNLSINGGQYML
jgi:acetoacetyl-CoA reductase